MITTTYHRNGKLIWRRMEAVRSHRALAPRAGKAEKAGDEPAWAKTNAGLKLELRRRLPCCGEIRPEIPEG